MQDIFVVWNGKGEFPPKFWHTSREAAEAEAERLARANPGERFHVLVSLGSCTRNDVQWDNRADGIPF